MSTGAPNRHLLRLWAIQFLFQRDYNRHDPWEDALELFLEDKKRRMSKRLSEFFHQRIDGVSMNLDDIDAQITRYSDNWDLHRMGGVDRNVLRLGFYELLYCEDVPPVVAVNEAVQLAKELSSDESAHFVNGILDRVIRTLNRPLRQGLAKTEI